MLGKKKKKKEGRQAQKGGQVPHQEGCQAQEGQDPQEGCQKARQEVKSLLVFSIHTL